MELPGAIPTRLEYGNEPVDNSRSYPKPEVISKLNLSRITSENNELIRVEEYHNFDTEILTHYDDSKHTVIIGKPGLGRTSLAYWLFDYNALVITELAQLCQFDRSVHDAIIFREVDLRLTFKELDMLTSKSSKLVTINKVEVLIPASTRLLFVTSITDGNIVPQSWTPIRRRLQKFSVTRPTYVEDIDDNIINITP